MRPMIKRIIAVASVVALLPLTLLAIPASAAFRNPIKAVYTSYDSPKGFAHGELTVTVDGWIDHKNEPMEAVVYWANSRGPIEGYTALARFKLTSRTTTFEFPTMQIIPEGADRLRVYTASKGTNNVSSGYIDAMLPANSDYEMNETPEYVFGVVSDTHVQNSLTADYNVKFKKMLADLNTIIASSNAKNSETGIFINGDAIDAYSQEGPDTDVAEYSEVQYANLWKMKAEASPNVPIYLAVGNHDLWPGDSLVKATELFLENAVLPDGSHPTSMTYDFWIGDCHFVFLGDDDWDTNYATINDEHLTWLDKTIKAGYDKGKTFLFLHQTLSNTVAGAITENLDQEHNGVINEAELRAVLRKYPDAVMFSGHSHYSINSVRASFYGGDGHMPKIFATSSVANPVDMFGKVLGNGASEGFIVEVYEDKIALRGRDFKTGEWMASAQYVIEYTDADEDLSVDNGNAGVENSGSSSGSISGKPSTNKPSGSTGNKNEPENENNENFNDENTNVNDTANGTRDSGEESKKERAPREDESGCGGAIALAPIAIAVPVALALKKKEEDD